MDKIDKRNSKVCLIRPPSIETIRFTTGSIVPPIGLAYIAAIIEEAEWDIKVIDAVGEGPLERTKYYRGFCVGLRISDIVKNIPINTSVVGISVTFSIEWPLVVCLVDAIKAANPGVRVVLGGEHITAAPEFCLMSSKADYLVLGEGEETIVDLLDALESGGSLENIHGIAYWKEMAIQLNPRRARHREIDKIPHPAWHHFRIDTYHKHGLVGGMQTPEMTMPLLATRGCPYQCTYCASANMWTTRWLPRDPKLVVDEIEYYIKKYNAKNFPFHDLTAIIKKDWIVAFCNEIIERKLDITWQLPTGTRSEAIDEEVAHLLVKSGMSSISYAPESGSAITRQMIKKKVNLESLCDSVKASKAAGLHVSCFLVIGFPHETPEQIAENLPFLDQLVDLDLDDMSINFFTPFPATELFNSLYDAGKIRFDYNYFGQLLEQTSFIPEQSHSDYLGRLGLAKWKIRLFLRFYLGIGREDKNGQALSWLPGIVTGFFRRKEEGDQSKLQTATQNAFNRGIDLLRCYTGRRWMSKRDEKMLFAQWDSLFRAARQYKIDQGITKVAPADSADLHLNNVNAIYKKEHEASYSLETEDKTASV
jgi:anaerobic magnesium-protoporphyrin IX monomethyl ester cyclase